MAICRYWRGWTTPQNADAYQDAIMNIIIPSIESRNIKGFNRIDLMRRDAGDEVEFSTLMWFESIASIKEFVGEDYEVANSPPEAKAVLKRWDRRTIHYEVIDERPQSEVLSG